MAKKRQNAVESDKQEQTTRVYLGFTRPTQAQCVLDQWQGSWGVFFTSFQNVPVFGPKWTRYTCFCPLLLMFCCILRTFLQMYFFLSGLPRFFSGLSEFKPENRLCYPVGMPTINSISTVYRRALFLISVLRAFSSFFFLLFVFIGNLSRR